jgi:NADPH-dependent glutamate synthase beta subunit-like oxidoreductase
MVRLWIDNRPVEVPAGSTVLQATRALGLDLPALCFHEGYPPNTSCMCCLARVDDAPQLVPACATVVREGMRVESETDPIHQLRRAGLELLLADHAGDCHAPCENTCPAHMDVPDMLRHVAEGDYQAAIATIKQDIALPAILGRVCPEVCENACRRGQHDSPAAICKVKQFVADRDLASGAPYRPRVAPTSGRRIAVVGGGPTGLTAAFHLAWRGHACQLFDREQVLGGRLHAEFSPEELPREVLQAEIDAVLAMGIETRLGVLVGQDYALDDLVREFDAVLLAVGRYTTAELNALGVQPAASGVRVDAASRLTSHAAVFAAGNAVRPYRLVVQSVAEGKLAAESIDCWLRGEHPPDRRRAFESRLARLTSGELCSFCTGSSTTPRVDARILAAGLTEELARQEAERCLHCECEALPNCRLHHYAAAYQCDARRFRDHPRPFEEPIVGEKVRLESGKCIACGICVQIAAAAPAAVGLAIVGRSLQLRVVPPPGVTLDDAFGEVAQQCAEACPTGAIVLQPH